jgi:single-strand DNA-binding protein
MNHVVVCGNISEPKVTFTKTGKTILTFGLATSRKVGEEKYTTWHNIKVWDQFAENLAESLQKGDRVFVAGRLESEQWEDKDGNKRVNIVIVAEEAGLSMRWTRNESQ